jgi:predicted transposase/invertase (TIGR01784 family)
MFADKQLFCTLVSSVTGKKTEIIGEPHSQASLREDDVLLNKICFDVFALSPGGYYSVDIQRRYYNSRQERRMVYYACRAVSTQSVRKMEYEHLQPVHISFILTQREEERAVQHIALLDVETHQVFDNLLNMTVVYVPAVLREHTNEDLFVFSKFFAVSSQEQADIFCSEFENNELAKELCDMYNNAVANVRKLRKAEKSPYYTRRLNESEKREFYEEGEQAGMQKGRQDTIAEIVVKLINAGDDPEKISKVLNIPVEQVVTLQNKS